MAKLITAVRLRADRAEKLREKSIELTIKMKEHVKEADLIHFLIDKYTDRIDMDKEGLFITDEDE